MGPAVIMRHNICSKAMEQVDAVDVARLSSNHQRCLPSDGPSIEEILQDLCLAARVVVGKALDRPIEELCRDVVARSGSMVQGGHANFVPHEQISTMFPELEKELRILCLIIRNLGRLEATGEHKGR